MNMMMTMNEGVCRCIPIRSESEQNVVDTGDVNVYKATPCDKT